MKTTQEINADLNDALAAARAYRGADLYLAFVKLLDAVDAQHRESLLTAKMDRVQYLQGAASQIRALRHALVHTGAHVSPIG
ncbi:hypothetical protein AAKU55_005265 [Oxalobacteraceae bacterium GrIS 1.11]